LHVGGQRARAVRHSFNHPLPSRGESMRLADFVSDPDGAGSSVRLIALSLSIGALAIVATICRVAIAHPSPEGTVAALAAPLTPLLAGIWAALRERTTPDPAADPPA
jgi:hypothetical protein